MTMRYNDRDIIWLNARWSHAKMTFFAAAFDVHHACSRSVLALCGSTW
jgi:hypothetical protein